MPLPRSWRSFRSCDGVCLARSKKRKPLRADLLEKSLRQEAQSDAGRVADHSRAQIWAEPCKAVGFRHNDPRAFIVEAKTALCCGWNLDRVRPVAWGRMRDRRNHHFLLAFIIGQREQHRARAVFDPFFLPAQMLTLPEVRIANDQTGRWRWKRRGSELQL